MTWLNIRAHEPVEKCVYEKPVAKKYMYNKDVP